MTIDWITVVAQLTNFLVLVLLLRWFLYRPILDGIDAREAQIAKRMHTADAATQSAELAERMHRDALLALEKQADTLHDEALLAAQAKADTLSAEAREALRAQESRWREALAKERVDLLGEVRSTAAHAIVQVTRKTLHDLADAILEDRIAAKLEAQLITLGPELAAKSGAADAIVFSSFALSQERRLSLTQAFRTHVANRGVDFQIDTNAAVGLVLQVGGARLGWNVDDYLDELDARLSALILSRVDRPEASL